MGRAPPSETSAGSRGPVTVDGSGRLKPDLTAPGSQVPNPVYGYGALRAVLPGGSLCPLFSDGFESGDTGAWSATVP